MDWPRPCPPAPSWTDLPDEKLAIGDKRGAKTVSQWRGAYLDDWKTRLDWLKPQ